MPTKHTGGNNTIMTKQQKQQKLEILLHIAEYVIDRIEEAELEDLFSGAVAAEINVSAYRLRNLIGRAYERSLGVLARYSDYSD